MMRSLFSGVSGLKTHQTRMDVIGNNIANVNTTAYKSQNMVFSDLLYQQTQAASGANAATGRGGINARQIGLGAKTAAINTAITRQGSAQSTNNPWDVMITGESFFIVNSGSQNFFTRDGSFTIDGAGNLVMASTGYKVMGWQVDPETGDIRSDVVSALQVMNRDNLTSPAEASTMAYASGILDKNDTNVHSKGGKVMTLRFYDALGYDYTALMSIHSLSEDGKYYVQLDDIINSDGISLVDYYNLENINQIADFGTGGQMTETIVQPLMDGVSFKDGANPGTTGTFQVDYNYEEILDGFANSPILGIAKPTLEYQNPAATLGATATLTGNVKLDKEVLLKEYGLIYDTDANPPGYYFPVKDANGNITGRTALTTTTYTEWGTVLGQLNKTGNTTGGTTTTGTPTVTIDQTVPIVIKDDGSVELSFTAQLDVLADYQNKATYNTTSGQYSMELTYNAATSTDEEKAVILEKAYGLVGGDNVRYNIDYISPTGIASITKVETYNGNLLEFDTKTGKFSYVGSPEQNSVPLDFHGSATDMAGATVDLGHFSDISIDFASVRNVNNGKVSTVGLDGGDGGENNIGAGRKEGALIGIEIGQDGRIRASYDNGTTKLLGQIAVAKFANAAGLAKAGNNLYSTTMNSGEFDGIGMDITSDGEGSMESGILEMSNVDLAGEFTEMITTQRGFQANSRIITTSDSMLEELVNLKR